ncbi:MAG: DegT/DnrJ/EryC1/StrS family aminotransferase [Gemmatimonadetes bacterium]|nr:DegT/DnrJ/EryC1/StrS family aminotransferase [Gemmatimonadota bacterium]
MGFDSIEEFWTREDLVRASAAAYASGEDLIRRFESAFLARLGGGGSALFVPSGRAGLRLALATIKTRARDRVLVPAFCCDVVGEAILREGLRPLLLDSGATVGSLDWNACARTIRTEKVAAVVVPHLFGLPLDIKELTQEARRHGTFVIEDCAHCLGGAVDGTAAGALGDFSIFSFNVEKPISMGGGGMLVSSPRAPIAPGDASRIRSYREARAPSPDVERTELAAWLTQQERRRRHVGQPARTTAERAGRLLSKLTHSRVALAVTDVLAREPEPRAGVLRAALGLALLERYPVVQSRRSRNHDYLAARLLDAGVGTLMSAGRGIVPAWLKAKLLVPEAKGDRIRALTRRLWRRGFIAGRITWPRTMDQEWRLALRVARLGPLPNAHRLARLGVDLPIHQNLRDGDLDALAACVIESLG